LGSTTWASQPYGSVSSTPKMGRLLFSFTHSASLIPSLEGYELWLFNQKTMPEGVLRWTWKRERRLSGRQGSPKGGRLLPRHVDRERISVEETGKKESKRSEKEETGKLFTDHNSIQSHPQDPTRTNSSTHK